MEKGNVLIIGNSGVGKSTLINAVLGENVAETGGGASGTTKELEVKTSKNGSVPFRIIDTIGFEPSLLKERKAVKAVMDWSKKSAKEGKKDNQINVIWFCVEGTSRKLFPKAIRDLSRATRMWPSVPLIAVITKSYSEPERQQNIDMVASVFRSQKKYTKNLKAIIPVVAQTYRLNDTAFAPPCGIEELIQVTNSLLPEGVQAAEKDVAAFILSRKRQFAHTVVAASATSAVMVAAVPIPFPDGAVLAPVELAEVNSLAWIYGIDKNEQSKKFLSSIVEVGTVGVAAKTVIKALTAIPGLNIGAAVLNAVIAGSIVASLGEASIYAFEQVYLGTKTLDDIDWVKKLIESRLSAQFIEKITEALQGADSGTDPKDMVKTIMKLLKNYT